MELIYDEKRTREELGTWEGAAPNGVDVFHLRVRLFKGISVTFEGVSRSEYPVYLMLQDFESYEGDPEIDRGPFFRQKKQAFVQGPDSKLIRRAIALANSFGGKPAYDTG